MKNLMMILALAFSLSASARYTTVFNSGTCITSLSPAFSFLRGHKQGNADHALQWSMTSTAGIDHYEIQSTYEDPFDIYSNWTVEGTAAVSNANITRFTHHSVMHGVISYRVIAILSNGAPAAVSDIYTVSIN